MFGARGALHEQPADDVPYAPGGPLGEPYNLVTVSLWASCVFLKRGIDIRNPKSWIRERATRTIIHTVDRRGELWAAVVRRPRCLKLAQ